MLMWPNVVFSGWLLEICVILYSSTSLVCMMYTNNSYIYVIPGNLLRSEPRTTRSKHNMNQMDNWGDAN